MISYRVSRPTGRTVVSKPIGCTLFCSQSDYRRGRSAWPVCYNPCRYSAQHRTVCGQTCDESLPCVHDSQDKKYLRDIYDRHNPSRRVPAGPGGRQAGQGFCGGISVPIAVGIGVIQEAFFRIVDDFLKKIFQLQDSMWEITQTDSLN